MTAILDVLTKGTAWLAKKGIPEARLNMEHLAAHVLGLSRMELYLKHDFPVSEADLKTLRDLSLKRSQGAPLQHVIGEVGFRRETFLCDSRALIPRPETEELVELALSLDFPRPARILDVGCGSGVIGLSLAKELGEACREMLLTDFSPPALELAAENAARLGVPALFAESDLFSALSGTFDLILANLPYVGEDERADLAPELSHDPEAALFSGPDGLDLIRRFVADVPKFLNPGGWVVMEVGHRQGKIVADLLRENGLADSRVGEDLNSIPRFPLARRA